MKRINGKRPKFLDEYERARENIRKIKEEIETESGMYSNENFSVFIDDILPVIPELNTVQEVARGVSEYRKLYGSSDSMFKTRADYERTRRYINRINKAAETEWTGDKDNFYLYDIHSTLTALKRDDDSAVTEFMRRENNLAARNENRKIIESLKEQGINMVKKPVMKVDFETGEFTYVYDESRHKVYQYVPETPEQERKYFYTVQRVPSLNMNQPAVPDDGYIIKWGDAVPVQKKSARIKHPKKIAETLFEDEYEADRARLYIENYKNMVDDVLPSDVAEMFDEVFDDILDLSPLDQINVVGNIIHGDEIADLEYWYREMGSAVAPKLHEIAKGLKESIEEVLDADDYEVFDKDVEDFEDAMGDSPLAQGQNVLATYQQKKAEGKVTTSTLDSVRKRRGRR